MQSFCQNQNPIQDEDQDPDFTLDFNTRPKFHTQKTSTKFCLDPLTPSKVIVSTARIHVRTARQPDRPTDRHTGIFCCLFCVLRLSLFRYSVRDEKVKNIMRNKCSCDLEYGCFFEILVVSQNTFRIELNGNLSTHFSTLKNMNRFK